MEFYKKFSDKLRSLLLNMFQESLNSGLLSQALRQALISLNYGSYCPISLLNVDATILDKVLARTGFIKIGILFLISDGFLIFCMRPLTLKSQRL